MYSLRKERLSTIPIQTCFIQPRCILANFQMSFKFFNELSMFDRRKSYQTLTNLTFLVAQLRDCIFETASTDYRH